MMIKLGFSEVWVDRVMKCVPTPSFSVRINGKAYGNIRPSRGIRQGNLLSPYLFLICVGGLGGYYEMCFYTFFLCSN